MVALMIYMTCSSQEEAEGISKILLEERLVACANIMPSHSAHYWWEGKIESASEVAVFLKTRQELFKQVEARISELHSYDVPCIVAWQIEQAHAPFLEWVNQACMKN